MAERRRRQVGGRGGSPLGWIVLALAVVGAGVALMMSDRRDGAPPRAGATTIYQTVSPARPPAPPPQAASRPSARPKPVSHAPSYPQGGPRYAPRREPTDVRPAAPAAPSATPTPSPAATAATTARAGRPEVPSVGGGTQGSAYDIPRTDDAPPGYDWHHPRPTPAQTNPPGIGSTPVDGGAPKGY